METTGSKLTDMTDYALVQLAIEQNQAAYIVLYTRYNIGVKSHISRYVAQKEDVEDICLESFQKAFSQIGTYNPEYKFSTWLYRIARNTAFDHLSKHDREKSYIPTTSISEDFAELKELFTGNGMVGFVAKERVDGKLVLPEAVQILKMGA